MSDYSFIVYTCASLFNLGRMVEEEGEDWLN